MVLGMGKAGFVFLLFGVLAEVVALGLLIAGLCGAVAFGDWARPLLITYGLAQLVVFAGVGLLLARAWREKKKDVRGKYYDKHVWK